MGNETSSASNSQVSTSTTATQYVSKNGVPLKDVEDTNVKIDGKYAYLPTSLEHNVVSGQDKDLDLNLKRCCAVVTPDKMVYMRIPFYEINGKKYVLSKDAKTFYKEVKREYAKCGKSALCDKEFPVITTGETKTYAGFTIVDSLPSSSKSVETPKNTSTISNFFKSEKKSIDPKISAKEVTKKASTNSFYDKLQQFFDDPDRSSRSIKNNVVSLTLGNNQMTPTIYNCGGNIKFNCTIPAEDDNYPNYTNIILNTKDATDQSVNLMNILTSFIIDPNFLSTYFFDENLSKSENGVPLINVSQYLDTPNMCWNWNAGRKYTLETVKNISNYYILKLNDLLDYIITNDLCSVDSEFSKKFLALFANADDYIYNHSNGTLVLPSLVNWLSSKNDGKYHALSMCGYIKKDSKIFPLAKGMMWNDAVKWNNKSDVTSNFYIEVPRNINNLITMSEYNYPFVSNNQNPQTVETPIISLNNISGINITFKDDKYSYNKHVEDAKKIKYATQYVGKKDNTTIGKDGSDKISFELTVSVSDMFNTSTRQYYGGYTVHQKNASCGKWAWCDKYRADSVDLKLVNANIFKLKDTNTLKSQLKPQIEKNIKKYSKVEDIGLESSKISDVVVNDIIIPSNYSKEFISSSDANKTNYKKCTGGYKDKDAGCCYVGYEYQCNDGTAASYLKLESLSANQQFKITVNVSYNYSTKRLASSYSGSIGYANGTSITDESPIKNDKAICLYTTNMDLYLFNENVFSYWVTMIKNTNNQQLVLNEMRKYINEHPALILVNKINNFIGKYARSFTSSVFFVGNPIGPPLITIPNSYVISYKNYFPSFKFVNNIDSDKITYIKSLECNNIINYVSCEKSNNYLDVLFRSIITESRMVDSEFDSNNIISIILPSKGYQLFEVIDKSMVSLVPDGYVVSLSKYTDTTSILYNFEIPKIIISFKDFASDNQSKTLTSSYKKITSINVPIINFSRKDENIDIMVDTLTGDNENLVHIYVSSDSTQEMICNLKGAGVDEKDKNVDKNSINNVMLNVQYNGIDSNSTPICLRLHFI